MNALRLILVSGVTFFAAAVWQQWRASGYIAAAHELRRASIVGLAMGTVWAISRMPFWRGVFLMISALTFFAIMLPDEALFLERHALFSFALPFVSGFVMAHCGESAVGTICSLAILLVLAVALVRAFAADPYLRFWLS